MLVQSHHHQVVVPLMVGLLLMMMQWVAVDQDSSAMAPMSLTAVELLLVA